MLGYGLRGDVDRPHKVVISKPFCMDRTEVTAAAWDDCVKAEVCKPPRWWGMWTTYPSQPDHPVNKVTWPEARAFCEFKKKSLPTEAQWEWAASGGDKRKWAWGNEPPDCTRTDFTPGVLPTPSPDAGCHGGGPSAVGSHPAGAKRWPAGQIHDLSGNVWEWCLDNYAPFTGEARVDPPARVDPLGVHVVRGGGWNRSAKGIEVGYRGGAIYNYEVPGLGFRCVRNSSRETSAAASAPSHLPPQHSSSGGSPTSSPSPRQSSSGACPKGR
jgi:formylglycine-generating enzyme required for sulfatase activity